MKKWLIHPVKRRLAKYYLFFLRKFFGLKVIGITGSAGKTTTKEMLFSILRLHGKTVASYANIDPVYNIPATILRCTPLTRYLVLEMGIEYPGEMDFYLWLARPDIGVITNIYPTHTQFFKNEAGVFSEKKKLAEGLTDMGVAVLNKDDKRLVSLSGKIKGEIVWFGKNDFKMVSGNEFTLKNQKSKLNIQLPILGRQFVQNALAAAKVSEVLGLSAQQIKIGLESFKPPDHRMRLLTHKSGAAILDDSYNNNPQAAKEALLTFEDFAKRKKKIVVMGDMLELGELEEKYHRELGEAIRGIRPDFVIGVGNASKVLVKSVQEKVGKAKAKWVPDETFVLKVLNPHLNSGSVVLIKGSRSIHLERVVERLIK